MGGQTGEKKNICAGLLAHVDAGKTTLSEGMLYCSGSIQKWGRVDKKDTFLDTDDMERQRGITIFSKMARLSYKDTEMVLLDTPGHVDFSAEMERTLQVLDYAILVISGTDGIQGHTVTLWRLLERYGIPVFIFVNKMDLPGAEKETILEQLQEKLNDGCVDFTEENRNKDAFYEAVAMCEERLLEHYLEEGTIGEGEIAQAVKERHCFPCFFGSALKLEGIEEFLDGMNIYGTGKVYPQEFGAKVYKIGRDRQGNRLTYLKVTGGSIKVRELLTGTDRDGQWEEKVNQIRLYSGEKYETVQEVQAGDVCAVTGLSRTYPGEGIGKEEDSLLPSLTPVLTYQIRLPEGIPVTEALAKLRQLEEEEPELHIVWREELEELQVQVMGEVQMEILTTLIEKQYGFKVSFGEGRILYQETIENTVEGVGHYEPLRHYAEVHLLLEPLERGSGLLFAADCPEEILDKNWQRLILTHLKEKEHKGVLTGAGITDMKITLVAGRAHQKHTEGGDFRQATYRAVRQGLKCAKSVLLEPYYSFELEVPQQMLGRAMTDIERMGGSFHPPESKNDMAVLKGSAPVVSIKNYQSEVASYTKGHGHLYQWVDGYHVCHNAEEVVRETAYDPESDLDNPTGSIFCTHGAGFFVPWDKVCAYMHVEGFRIAEAGENVPEEKSTREAAKEIWLGTDEVDDIIDRTFYANRKDGNGVKNAGWKYRKKPAEPVTHTFSPDKKTGKPYLLVDGYNIIYAWDDLKELAKDNLDGARGRLLDILCNYQGMKDGELIVVFDAYRVEGHPTEYLDYKNIHVVYTKEAETADQYIEKFSHENGKKYDITVATSDGLEQVIIRGHGCHLLSARELERDVRNLEETLRTGYLANQTGGGQSLKELLPE